MNTAFFIGNGFDINLGMKTRYSDFYEYYKNAESKSDSIKKLKKKISDEIINWSDLEIALGKYTVNFEGVEDFEEVYYDIADSLADYLKEQEDTDLNMVKLDAFLRDLSFPEKYLPDEDMQELTFYKSNWSSHIWYVRIITLNYTRTIERILGNIKVDSSIGTTDYGYNILYKGIQHIHGYTDERLVLGLNDISQLDNINFHDKEDILDSIIKIQCNQVQRHNVDKVCKGIIEKAELICIFGSSIGDTDNYWWNLIGNQLRRNCRVIIFSRGEGIRERFAHRAAKNKRAIVDLFLKKTDLSDDEVLKFKKNVYIGINAGIFSLKS